MESAILKGIILGIGISAPIGPINTEIVRRGLHGGFWPAWMVGAGAGIAHAVFLAAAYVGMSSLVEVWAVRLALFGLGFCLLAWVAVSSFRDAWRGAGNPGLVRPVSDGWRAAFAAGFGFAFLNPLAVLLWVSLVGAPAFGQREGDAAPHFCLRADHRLLRCPVWMVSSGDDERNPLNEGSYCVTDNTSLGGTNMAILEANDVSKQYQMGEVTVDALDGVDFVVEKGEFVAVMGPSGSGKSTLLHLLGGLDTTTDGEVTLGGRKLSVMSDKEVTLARRRNVGFVFQFYNLLPTLTAEENIALPLLIDAKKLKEYQSKVDELLELVGLTDRRKHKPDQLSGGEQQRVAIARAFVNDPDIVLADEPTGNLDSRAGEEIMKLLRRSCDELGQTIVVVTHDPKAASFADRIVFLKDGQIASEIRLEKGGDTAPILEQLGELDM
jgi:putative ABC transport system ATP-binding protein